MEKYSKSGKDVVELENENGTFHFLIPDLGWKILQLALEIFFLFTLSFIWTTGKGIFIQS